MQKLCRRVVELLKKHPILWLPYLVAELLAIFLWRLRGLAEHGIFHWFTTDHSVLGGDIASPRPGHAALTNASIAYLPIGIATIVMVVCLLVASLLATAAMVDSIEQEQRPDTRKILADLVARWRRILLFSLRFLITFGFFAGGTAALLYYMLFLAHRRDLLASSWSFAGIMLVGVGSSTWLILPTAMRLVGEKAAVLVSAQARNRGTIVAILATAAGAAIGFFVWRLEASMALNSRWEIAALSVSNSVISNAPDVLLFVALALLASEFSGENESKKDSGIREFLTPLMPLHFGKNGEPPQVEG